MAATSFSLPTFPPFDVHADGNTGLRWKKWLGRFERLLVAMNITDKKQQRAMLLHFAGPAVDEIFDTLSDTGEAKDYDKAIYWEKFKEIRNKVNSELTKAKTAFFCNKFDSAFFCNKFLPDLLGEIQRNT